MKLKVYAINSLLCILLLVTPAAWAALPLITDDTGTQGKGKFQLEASGTWLHDKEREGSKDEQGVSTLAVVAFTAGVAETLDVAVTVPYIWTKTDETGQDVRVSGVSDTLAEAKWRFYDKQKLSLAVKPGVLVPTGDADKGLGTGHVGCSVFVISTIEALPWSFDANLGYLYLPNSQEDITSIWFGSLASRLEVAERWKIVGEIGEKEIPIPLSAPIPLWPRSV